MFFDPLITVAVAGSSVLVGGLLAVRLRRWRRQAAAAARRCGLEIERRRLPFLDPALLLRARLAGHAGVAVEIRCVTGGWAIVARGFERLRTSRLAAEGVASGLGRLVGRTDAEVGDPTFDRCVRVDALPAEGLACLDRLTRTALVDLFRIDGRVRLAGGALNVSVRRRHGSRLEDAVERTVRVAARLGEPLDAVPALARIALQDPLPAVRLTGLRALAREHPEAAETQATLREACDDRDESVVLAAALRRGDAGHEALLRLAREAEGDDTAAAAIAGLGTSIATGAILDLLRGARSGGRARKAVACIDALAAPPEGAAKAQPVLLGLLSDAADGVAVAAARALGRLGTIQAVLPLQRAGEGDDRALRAAARQAVAEIQARTQGAAPGQVSLASGEAGQVSLADERGGRVSMADED